MIIGEEDCPLDENRNPTGDVIALLYPDGNLIISGSGSIPSTCTFDGWDFESAGGWAFTNSFDLANRISKITINEGLTSIPDNCFFNLEFVDEIYIPSTVTYIGSEIFGRDFPELTNVIFSPGFAGTFHIGYEKDNVQYSDSFCSCPWLVPYDYYTNPLCVTHKVINGIGHEFICYYE